MKILLLGPKAPPMGGIARYCQDIMASKLLKKFEIEFFDVTVPMIYRQAAYSKSKRQLLRQDGFVNTIRQYRFVFNNYLKYLHKISKDSVKLVHIISCTGYGFWRNAVFIWFAKRKRISTIWHIVGEIDVFWDKSSLLRKKLIRYFLNKADLHIVQSHGIRKKTVLMTDRPVKTIYNGVQINDYSLCHNNLDSIPPTDNKTFRVVTLGVLSERKGYYDLIEIAKRFKKISSNIKFIFIGGGELDKFQSIIDSLRLGDLIKLSGSINDQKKNNILMTSDLFVLPTYAEGQPISILEGMAAGLPIISTSVGSIPEIVKEDNGCILEPGDLSALYKFIVEFMDNAKLRSKIGLNNRAKAIRLFSLDRVFSELDVVYKNMI